MRSRTLVLNGKLAAVWQLHEDGSIEHFHFTAYPGTDTNRVLLHIVTRPGDEDYDGLMQGFQPQVAA